MLSVNAAVPVATVAELIDMPIERRQALDRLRQSPALLRSRRSFNKRAGLGLVEVLYRPLRR
jgi:hypothetical protein